MKDVADCDWLNEWRDLSQKFAFQYNPSLQPRALVVFGCINKRPSLRHIKKIMTIMGKVGVCNFVWGQSINFGFREILTILNWSYITCIRIYLIILF